jgi:hypothetical protein
MRRGRPTKSLLTKDQLRAIAAAPTKVRITKIPAGKKKKKSRPALIPGALATLGRIAGKAK